MTTETIDGAVPEEKRGTGTARQLEKMRALVTGGAGFIGSHLTEALRSRGAAVAALDDLSSGRRDNLPEDVPLFVVDIRDRDEVFRAVREFRPTHVFHQAAQASVKVSVDDPVADADVNIIGGLHVLDASRDAGVERFVFASTGGALYGEVPEGEAASEQWPAAPKSPYGAGKAAFETYLDVYRQNFGLPYTVLRYANVYGPRQDPFGEAGVVAIFVDRLLQGEHVSLFARRRAGDDGCVRDYVVVDDVVAANVMAAVKGLDGFFNVGTGVGTTTRQLLNAAAAAVGVEAAVTPGPPRAGDLERSVLDAGKLRAAGWPQPVPLSVGLQRTVDWFKGKGGRGT